MEKIIVIFFIIIVAIFLRFYHLNKRGVLFWDDGVRLNYVLFIDDLVNFLIKNFKKILNKEKKLEEEVKNFRGQHLCTANTLDVFIYWIVGKLIKNFEFSPLFVNALFGVLGIIGIFFTSNLMGGEKIGILSVFLLSISGYHLMYSRAFHGDIGCGTFYIWATFFYLLSTGKNIEVNLIYLAISGFLISFAFLYNSRQFYIPIFFIFYEFILFILQPSIFFISRILILSLTMMLPLVITQEIFVILKEIGYPYPTYFNQLLRFGGHFSKFDFKFPGLKMYIETFYNLEGIIIPIFFIVGNFFLIKNLSCFWKDKIIIPVILFTQFWIPFLLWASRGYKIGFDRNILEGKFHPWNNSCPRHISTSIYSMVIVTSIGLTVLPNNFFYILLFFILIINLYNNLNNIISVKSGYKDAINFIKNKTGDGKHISFCYPISAFYVGNNNVIDINILNNKDDFFKFYQEGQFRYLLYIKMIHLNSFKNIELLNEILNILKPSYKIFHGFAKFKPFIYDELNTLSFIMPHENFIEIYDLSQYYELQKQFKK